MKIINAEFIKSADVLKNCPTSNLPEIAMIGRSNVGKSSFINAVCNRKKLAKTSNTPGKTRLINLYNINNEFILTDLPGYGYAKISKTEQQKWKGCLEEYILNRENLCAVIQLIDARHSVQNNDLQMRDWLDYNKIPVITIATKTDALSKSEAKKSVNKIAETFVTQVTGFSAKSYEGRDDILKIFSDIISTSKS